MNQTQALFGAVNAFDRLTETYYLPASSQLLWYKLLGLFNRSMWAEWIEVDNQRLMALIQCKREATFIETRNNLIRAELIEYQKGRKGVIGKYRLTFTSVSETVPNSVPNSVSNSVPNSVGQTVDTLPKGIPNGIPKTKTKTKTKTNTDVQPIIDEFCGADAELRDAFNAFAEMRIGKKNAMTVKAAQLTIKKLSEHSRDVQIAMLEQSVIGGWTSVYEPKQGNQYARAFDTQFGGLYDDMSGLTAPGGRLHGA